MKQEILIAPTAAHESATFRLLLDNIKLPHVCNTNCSVMCLLSPLHN